MAPSTEAGADPLLLTEDTVELVMRLLLADRIDRTVTCAFVRPWVEQDLPSTTLAQSGAQTVHGLDLVAAADGRVRHPPASPPEHEYAVDRAELVRRCEAWLSTRALRRLEDVARGLRADGVDVDEVLTRLRAQGASIVDCVKLVRVVDCVPLGEAKVVVDRSTAWASHREGNRRLRSAMVQEAQRMARESRATTPAADEQPPASR